MKKKPQVPHVDGSRGAPMGRDSFVEPTFGRCRCFRLRFIDNAYDEGGAYWGEPADVWCCTDSPTAGDDAQIFITCRAQSRAEAKKEFEKDAPELQRELYDYRYRTGCDPAPLPAWPGIKWRN
jgi:hypothetical protein